MDEQGNPIEGAVQFDTAPSNKKNVKIIDTATNTPLQLSKRNAFDLYKDPDLYSGIKNLNSYDKGFDPRYHNDQEAFRSTNQGWGNQIATGLGRFAGTAITKTAQGLAAIPAGISALSQFGYDNFNKGWDQGMSSSEMMTKFNDNPLVQGLTKVEDAIKESLPIYHSLDYKTGNILDKMMTTSFWADDFVDGAAFMASAFAGAAVTGKAMQALGVLDKMDDVYRATQAIKAGETGVEIGGNAIYRSMANLGMSGRGLERGGVTAFNTFAEASAEARDSKHQVMQELNQKRMLGLQGVPGFEAYANMTDDEVNIKSSEAAKSVFGANLAILALSNGVESNWFVKRAAAKEGSILSLFKGKSREEMIQGIEEIYKGANWKNRLGKFATASGKGLAVEGLWEENFQNATQNYFGTLNNTMNPHEKEYKANDFAQSIFDGFTGTGEALWGMTPFGDGPVAGSDKDKAATAVILGGLLGMMMAPASVRREEKQLIGKQKEAYELYYGRPATATDPGQKGFDEISRTTRNVLFDKFKSSLKPIEKDVPDPKDPTKTIKQKSYMDDNGYIIDEDKMHQAYFNQLTDQRQTDHSFLAALKGDKLYQAFNEDMQLFRAAWALESSGYADKDHRDVVTELMFTPKEKELDGVDSELFDNIKEQKDKFNTFRELINKANEDSKDTSSALNQLVGDASKASENTNEAFNQQMHKNLAFLAFNKAALTNLLDKTTNPTTQAEIEAEIAKNDALYNKFTTDSVKKTLRDEHTMRGARAEFNQSIEATKAHEKKLLTLVGERVKLLAEQSTADVTRANELETEIQALKDEAFLLEHQLKETQKIYGIHINPGESLESYDRSMQNPYRQVSLRAQSYFNTILTQSKNQAIKEYVASGDLVKAIEIINSLSEDEINELPDDVIDPIIKIRKDYNSKINANNNTIDDIDPDIASGRLQELKDIAQAIDDNGYDGSEGAEDIVNELSAKLGLTSDLLTVADIQQYDGEEAGKFLNAIYEHLKKVATDKINGEFDIDGKLVKDGLKQENEKLREEDNKLRSISDAIKTNRAPKGVATLTEEEVVKKARKQYFINELLDVINFVKQIINSGAFDATNMSLADSYESAMPLAQQERLLEKYNSLMRFLSKRTDIGTENKEIKTYLIKYLLDKYGVDLDSLGNIIQLSIDAKKNYFLQRKKAAEALEKDSAQMISEALGIDMTTNDDSLKSGILKIIASVLSTDQTLIFIDILQSNAVGTEDRPISAMSSIAFIEGINFAMDQLGKDEKISAKADLAVALDAEWNKIKAQVPDASKLPFINAINALNGDSAESKAKLKNSAMSTFANLLNQSVIKLSTYTGGYLNKDNTESSIYTFFKTYDINEFLTAIKKDRAYLASLPDSLKHAKETEILEALAALEQYANVAKRFEGLNFVTSLFDGNLNVKAFSETLEDWHRDNVDKFKTEPNKQRAPSFQQLNALLKAATQMNKIKAKVASKSNRNNFDNTMLLMGSAGTGKTSVLLKLLYNYLMKNGYVDSDILFAGHSTSSGENVNLEFGRTDKFSVNDLIADPKLVEGKKLIVLDEAFAASNDQLDKLRLANPDKIILFLGDPSQTKGELGNTPQNTHQLTPTSGAGFMYLLPALTQNYRSFIPAINETASVFQDRTSPVTIISTTANMSKLEITTTPKEANGVIVETENSITDSIIKTLTARKGTDTRTRVIQVSNVAQVTKYEQLLAANGITGVDVGLWQDIQGRSYDETYIDFDLNKDFGKSGITSDKPGFVTYYNSAMYTAITRGRYFVMVGYGNAQTNLTVDPALSKTADNSADEKEFNTNKFISNKIDLTQNLGKFVPKIVNTSPAAAPVTPDPTATATTPPPSTTTIPPPTTPTAADDTIDVDAVMDEAARLAKELEDLNNKNQQDAADILNSKDDDSKVTTTEDTIQEEHTIDDNSSEELDSLEDEIAEESNTLDERDIQEEQDEEIRDYTEEQEAIQEAVSANRVRNTESKTVSLNYPESKNLQGRHDSVGNTPGTKKNKEFKAGNKVVFVYAEGRNAENKIYVVHLDEDDDTKGTVLGLWGPLDEKDHPDLSHIRSNMGVKESVRASTTRIEDISEKNILGTATVDATSPIRFIYDSKNPQSPNSFTGFTSMLTGITSNILNSLGIRGLDNISKTAGKWFTSDNKSLNLEEDGPFGHGKKNIFIKTLTYTYAQELTRLGRHELAKIVEKHVGKIGVVIRNPQYVKEDGTSTKESNKYFIIVMEPPLISKESWFIKPLQEFKALLDNINHEYHNSNTNYLTLGSPAFTLVHDAVTELFKVEDVDGKGVIKLKDKDSSIDGNKINYSNPDSHVDIVMNKFMAKYKEMMNSKLVKKVEDKVERAKTDSSITLSAHEQVIAQKLFELKNFVEPEIRRLLQSDENKKSDPAHVSILDSFKQMVLSQMLVGINKKENKISLNTLIDDLNLFDPNSEYRLTKTGDGRIVVDLDPSKPDYMPDNKRWVLSTGNAERTKQVNALIDELRTERSVGKTDKQLYNLIKQIKQVGMTEEVKGPREEDAWKANKHFSLIKSAGKVQKIMDDIARANEKVGEDKIRVTVMKKAGDKRHATKAYPLLPSPSSTSSLIGNIKKIFINHVLCQYDFTKDAASGKWGVIDNRTRKEKGKEAYTDLRGKDLKELRNEMFFDLFRQFEGKDDEVESVLSTIKDKLNDFKLRPEDIVEIEKMISSAIEEDVKTNQGNITNATIDNLLDTEAPGYKLIEPIIDHRLGNSTSQWTYTSDMEKGLNGENSTPETRQAALDKIDKTFTTNFQGAQASKVMLDVEKPQAQTTPVTAQLNAPFNDNVEDLRDLPTSEGNEETFDKALDKLHEIRRTKFPLVRMDKIMELLSLINNKNITADKVEQVLKTKSKLIGSTDYLSYEYLEKYVYYTLKDFSKQETTSTPTETLKTFKEQILDLFRDALKSTSLSEKVIEEINQNITDYSEADNEDITQEDVDDAVLIAAELAANRSIQSNMAVKNTEVETNPSILGKELTMEEGREYLKTLLPRLPITSQLRIWVEEAIAKLKGTTKETKERIWNKYYPQVRFISATEAQKYAKDGEQVWGFVKDGFLSARMNESGNVHLNVLRHEAFHYTWKYYMTEAERQQVTKTATKFFERANINFQALNTYDREELLAELYQERDKVLDKKRNGVLARLFDFIEKMMGFGTKYLDDLNLFFEAIEKGKFDNRRELLANSGTLSDVNMMALRTNTDDYKGPEGVKQYLLNKQFIQRTVFRLIEEGKDDLPVPEWGLFKETFNEVIREINIVKAALRALKFTKTAESIERKRALELRLKGLEKLVADEGKKYSLFTQHYQALFPSNVNTKISGDIISAYDEAFNEETEDEDATISDITEDDQDATEDNNSKEERTVNIRNETRDLELQDASKSLTTVMKQFLSRVPARTRTVDGNGRPKSVLTGEFLNPTDAYTSLLAISEYIDMEKLVDMLQGEKYDSAPDELFTYLKDKFTDDTFHSLLEYIKESVVNKVPNTYNKNSIKVRNRAGEEAVWTIIPKDKRLISYTDPFNHQTTYYYIYSETGQELNKHDISLYNIQNILSGKPANDGRTDIKVIDYSKKSQTVTTFENFLKAIEYAKKPEEGKILNRALKALKEDTTNLERREAQLKDEKLLEFHEEFKKEISILMNKIEANQKIVDEKAISPEVKKEFKNLFTMMKANEFIRAYHNTVGSFKRVDYMFSESDNDFGKYKVAYKHLSTLSDVDGLVSEINNGLSSKMAELALEGKRLPPTMLVHSYDGFKAFLKEINVYESDVNLTKGLYDKHLNQKWKELSEKLALDTEETVQEVIRDLGPYIRSIAKPIAKTKVGSRKTSITTVAGKLVYLEQLSTRLDDVIRKIIKTQARSEFMGTSEEGFVGNVVDDHLLTNFFRNNLFVRGINKIHSITTHDAHKNLQTGKVKQYEKENDQEWYRRNFVMYFLDSVTANSVTVDKKTELRYHQAFFPLEDRTRMHAVKMNILKREDIKKSVMHLLVQLQDRNEMIGELYSQKSVRENDAEGLLQTNFMFRGEDGKQLLEQKEFTRMLNDNKFEEIWAIVDQGLKASAKRSVQAMLDSKIYLPWDLNKIVTALSGYGMNGELKDINNGRGKIALNESMQKKLGGKEENVFKNKKNGKYMVSTPEHTDVLQWLAEIYTYNSFVNGYALNQLVGGDFAMYKNAADVIKRWGGVSASRMKVFTNNFIGAEEKYKAIFCQDYAVGDYYNNPKNPEFKAEVQKLKTEIQALLGKTELSEQEKKDLQDKKDRFEQMEEDSKKSSIELFLNRLMVNSPLSVSQQNKLIADILGSFGGSFEMSDAQSFITPKRAADLKDGLDDAFKLADVNKPVHYGHEIKSIPINKTVYTTEAQAQAAADAIIAKKDARNKALKLDPSKIKYDITPTVDGTGYTINEDFSTPVYLKTSAITLTDELVNKLPQLKKLRTFLETHEIDELHFKSGIKVGAPKKFFKIGEMIDAEDNVDLNSYAAQVEESSWELSNKNYGIQYNPQSHVNSKVSLFTQLLYFTAVDTADLERSEHIYKALSYLIDAGLMDSKLEWQIDNMIDSAIKVLSKGEENAAFVELLQQNRNLNSPMLDSKLITAMASSMAKSTVLQKFDKSGKFVLQSAVFADKTDPQNKIRFDGKSGNTPLLYKFENGKMYAECYLPEAFLKDNPAFMEMVKSGKTFENFDLFGFRIPSTEIHSGILLKVVGFHSTESTTIIVPKEVPAISGADFDVDALFVIKRQYADKHLFNMIEARVKVEAEDGTITDEIRWVTADYMLQEEIKEAKKLPGTTPEEKDARAKKLTELADELTKIAIIKKNEFLGYKKNDEGFLILDNGKATLTLINDKIKTTNNLITELNRKGFALTSAEEASLKNLNKYLKDLKAIEKQAVRNIIVENTMAVMADPNNLKRMLNPISLNFIKGKQEDSTYSMLSKLGYDDLLNMRFNVALPDEQLQMFKIIFAGASLTGVNANDMKVFAYMLLGGVGENGQIERKLNPPKLNADSQFSWLGYTYTGVEEKSKSADGNGMSMWQIKDSMVNAAIDNVKELVLGIINANYTTINAFNTLIGLGMPFNDVVLMMYQPAIKLFNMNDFQGDKVEAVVNAQRHVETLILLKKGEINLKDISNSKLLGDKINTYKESESYKKRPEITKDNALADAKNGESDKFTNVMKELLNDLEGKTDKITKALEKITIEQLERQHEVLNLFGNATDIGNQISAVSRILGPLRAPANTLEELYDVMDAIEEIGTLKITNQDGTTSTYIDHDTMLKARKIELVQKEGLPLNMTNFFQANPHVNSSLTMVKSLVGLIHSNFLIHNPKLTKLLETFNHKLGRLELTKGAPIMSSNKDRVLLRREFSKYLQAQVILEELEKEAPELMKDTDISIEIDGITEITTLSGADAFKHNLGELLKKVKRQEKEDVKAGVITEDKQNVFLANIRVTGKGTDINSITFASANMKEDELAAFQEAFIKLEKLDPRLPKMLTLMAGLQYGFRIARNNYVSLIPNEMRAKLEADYTTKLSEMVAEIETFEDADFTVSDNGFDDENMPERAWPIVERVTQFYLDLYRMNTKKFYEYQEKNRDKPNAISTPSKVYRMINRTTKRVTFVNTAADYASVYQDSNSTKYSDLSIIQPMIEFKADEEVNDNVIIEQTLKKVKRLVRIKNSLYLLSGISVNNNVPTAHYVALNNRRSWTQESKDFSLDRLIDNNFLNVPIIKLEAQDNGRAILHTNMDLSRFMTNGDLSISLNERNDVNKLKLNVYSVIKKYPHETNNYYKYEVVKMVGQQSLGESSVTADHIIDYRKILMEVIKPEQANANDACGI